jgi:ATP-dependent protease HslVU (ClpYQ) peptidase subunit
MSVVIGVEYDGRVYMGSDSLATMCGEKRFLPHGKIFKTNEYLIGFTGSMRTANVLMGLDYPDEIYQVADHIRCELKDYDLLNEVSDEDGSLKVMGSYLLVGYQGELYEIQHDFSLIQRIENYAAIGDASSHAMGFLYATEGRRMSPRTRIKQAIECCTHFCTTVGGEIYIDSIK